MSPGRPCIVLTLLLAVAGCGGGGGTQDGPPDVSLTFTATPATIATGTAATLDWTAANATDCEASGGWSGSRATSGSQSTGNLAATTSYTLTCDGDGDSAVRTVTVTVSNNQPAPTVTLAATPATVASGAASQLTWSSTSATACTASGGWSGPKATSGTQSTGNLATTTTFSLTCNGPGGQGSRSRTVTVSSGTSQFPLRTEAGKRYLVDAQGNPFFMNGDTAWSLIVQLTLTEAGQYLEDRRQRGMNTVLVELIEHEFADDAPRNRAGEAPFLTAGDFATPNDDYFDHAVAVVDLAASKGMLVLLTPSYMGYPNTTEGWYAEMVANGTTKLRNYGRYVGQRFAGRDNILWVHGGDRDPPVNPGLNLANAIRDGIVESDPTGRWLHTWHAERGTSAGDSVAGGEPWLDVDNIYTSSTDVVDEALAAYAASSLPVFLSEARYEDNGGSGPFIRQQAYQALLSGATTGHLMGNDPIWYFGANWQDYLDSEGARSMAPIKALFTGRQWWLLEPDGAGLLVTAGVGSGASRTAAALADDRSFALAYLPAVRTLTVDLGRLAGPRVDARWFDPADGTYASIAGAPFNASGSRGVTPGGTNSQGAGDWVLVLESIP